MPVSIGGPGAQRNVDIFRKLFVDECGAFLALLRLGGNKVEAAGSALAGRPGAGVLAAQPTTGAGASSGRAQFLAQRLYACISSVITGDVDPRCLISVLEEFMMLETDDVSGPRCLRRPTHCLCLTM